MALFLPPVLPLPAGTAPLDDLGSAVQQRDLAVQAAALQALEALCGAGGALLSPAQRRQLDDAACHLAATSAAAARHLSADAEAAVGPALAALHLAALRLLLATVLAPAPHRPPHLAPALRLFHQGCGGGGCGCGGPLAVFCRQVRHQAPWALPAACLPACMFSSSLPKALPLCWEALALAPLRWGW